MRISVSYIASIIMCLAAGLGHAETALNARDVRVQGIYVTRPHDTGVYCLLGGGNCLIPGDAGIADDFITQWWSHHPHARVVAISTERKELPANLPLRRETYVWLEDGAESVNVALVRNGFYSATAMSDMVETDERARAAMEDIYRRRTDPAMRELVDKRRALVPAANRPRRLISDLEYTAMKEKLKDAEAIARKEKLGIWDDARSQIPESPDLTAKRQLEFPARDLYVSGIFAHRVGNPDRYCLVGSQTCRLGIPSLFVNDNALKFIDDWLTRHPKALATPLSDERRTLLPVRTPKHFTYVWIEEGRDSLNVALVHQGFAFAHELIDMVDADAEFMRQFDAPGLQSAKDQIQKERQQEEPAERLLPDSSYSERMKLAEAAERDAERHQRGLWSEAGSKLWRPPADARMEEVFEHHENWFREIASLIQAEPRLLDVNRSPESRTQALNIGIALPKVDQYLQLLRKLDANALLTNVAGLGKACLVTTDILYGLFDNGVIKGYVLDPGDPQPVVEDLEHWPEGLDDGAPAFRPLRDRWYLFEIHH